MNYELMMRFLASLEMTGAPDEREGAVSGGCAAADCFFTRTVCGVIASGSEAIHTLFSGLLRAVALAMTRWIASYLAMTLSSQ